MKRSEEAAVNAYKQINGKLEEAARGAVDIERENRTLREKVDLLEDDKLRQTRETEEAFRQRHTTEMALAQLRTRCVPRDEYRQVVDEVEDLRRELNKKNIVEKKRDELEQKTKEMEEELANLGLTVQVKKQMLDEQNAHIAKMRQQLAQRTAQGSDMAAKLKAQEKDWQTKIEREAADAADWRTKYEEDVIAVQDQVSDLAAENEALQAKAEQLEATAQRKDRALDFAQTELLELRQAVEAEKQHIKAESEGRLRAATEALREETRLAEERWRLAAAEKERLAALVPRLEAELETHRQYVEQRDNEMKVVIREAQRSKKGHAAQIQELSAVLSKLHQANTSALL
eukprot:GHVU01111640.1.p1 GENE.GHVU01111640.1~~GHVU01111640.1.p1  ORF type:complete len:345 (+),score=114.95 GHVU01111640.1:509-1543(+)